VITLTAFQRPKETRRAAVVFKLKLLETRCNTQASYTFKQMVVPRVLTPYPNLLATYAVWFLISTCPQNPSLMKATKFHNCYLFLTTTAHSSLPFFAMANQKNYAADDDDDKRLRLFFFQGLRYQRLKTAKTPAYGYCNSIKVPYTMQIISLFLVVPTKSM
jgi:hypothetical protein